MKWRIGTLSLLVPLLVTLTSCDQSKENEAQKGDVETQETNPDESEVRTQAQLYIEAINSGDIDRIIKFWSPEAVYQNPITGDLVQGKKEMREELAKIYEHLAGAKLEFRIDTIRFPVEGKASDEGIAILTFPGEEPIHSDYKMIHVKKDGKWLILHVSQLDFGMLDERPKK